MIYCRRLELNPHRRCPEDFSLSVWRTRYCRAAILAAWLFRALNAPASLCHLTARSSEHGAPGSDPSLD